MVQGGHAIVAVLTEGATPVYKATIVPRGSALGMVTQLADKDEVHMTLQQMLARLDVCMGGRVAEEVRPPPPAELDSRHALCCARPHPPLPHAPQVVFGANSITSGASSDLEAATATARAMVEKCDACLVIYVHMHVSRYTQ